MLVFTFLIPPRLLERNHRSYLLQRLSIDYTIVWDAGGELSFQPVVVPQWFYALACNELAEAKGVWGCALLLVMSVGHVLKPKLVVG